MGRNSLEKIKTQEAFITALRITAEDEWLKNWVRQYGDKIIDSPHYLYLTGMPSPMSAWMQIASLPIDHLTIRMMETLQSIIKEGQKEPILIYEDMRINSGHKRAACMLFLGYDKIKVKIVPKEYKL